MNMPHKNKKDSQRAFVGKAPTPYAKALCGLRATEKARELRPGLRIPAI